MVREPLEVTLSFQTCKGLSFGLHVYKLTCQTKLGDVGYLVQDLKKHCDRVRDSGFQCPLRGFSL